MRKKCTGHISTSTRRGYKKRSDSYDFRLSAPSIYLPCPFDFGPISNANKKFYGQTHKGTVKGTMPLEHFFCIGNLITLLLLKTLKWLSAAFKMTCQYTVLHKLAHSMYTLFTLFVILFYGPYSPKKQFKTCYSNKLPKPATDLSLFPHSAF